MRRGGGETAMTFLVWGDGGRIAYLQRAMLPHAPSPREPFPKGLHSQVGEPRRSVLQYSLAPPVAATQRPPRSATTPNRRARVPATCAAIHLTPAWLADRHRPY